MSIVSLTINNTIVNIRRDEEGRVNMNDLHLASAKPASKKPSNYLRRRDATALAASLSTAHFRAVVSYEGQGENRGTYAHESIAMAYAAWIDNTFYVAVAEVFGHAANGDGEAAVAAAQRVAARSEGIQVRKNLTRSIASFRSPDYSLATNAVYRSVFGTTAEGLRGRHRLTRSASVRDNMTEDELIQLSAAEAIMTLALRKQMSTTGTSREDLFMGLGRGQHIIEQAMGVRPTLVQNVH